MSDAFQWVQKGTAENTTTNPNWRPHTNHAEPNLMRLAALIRKRHREIVLEWMNTLEEASWIDDTPAAAMTDTD